MKKLLLTIGLTAVIASSSLAQGNFVFSTTASYVWDAWSGVPSGTLPRRDNSNYVAFLIGTGSSAVGEAFGQATPTNQSAVALGAWNSILNDSNYKFATNAGTGALVVAQTGNTGGISYLNGSTFTVAGTAAGGGTVSVFVIGWSVLYGSNPFAAALAGAPLGWSLEFNYAYGAGPNPGPAGTPDNFATQGLTAFGVQPVPEPTSLALAGLGMASLLVFRRRKSK